MNKNIQDQWAVVTGASSGIGVDIASELARRGANVVVVARREDRLRTLASRLHAEHGVQVECIPFDLGQENAAAGLMQELDRREIQPELFVNNAGIAVHGEFLAADYERYRQMIQLNIRTLSELTYAVGQRMMKRGSGRILLISSTGSFIPMPLYAAYSASKAYVRTLGEALHVEWKGKGPTITVCCPGATRTGFFAAAGHEAPEDNLVMRMITMDSPAVARQAVHGMLANKRTVVPGLRNQFLINIARIMPGRIVLPLAGRAFH